MPSVVPWRGTVLKKTFICPFYYPDRNVAQAKEKRPFTIQVSYLNKQAIHVLKVSATLWIINTNENSRNSFTIVSTCVAVYEAYSAVSSLLYTALLDVTSPNDNLPEIRTSLNVSPRKEVKT
jgi:hypothetical protein